MLQGYSFWQSRNSKHQLRIFMYIQSLLPEEEVHMVFCNFYVVLTSQNYLHNWQGTNYEIDIAIPSLKFGIEYQGEQHFKAIFTSSFDASRKVILKKIEN